jgi:hypothetical protein
MASGHSFIGATARCGWFGVPVLDPIAGMRESSWERSWERPLENNVGRGGGEKKNGGAAFPAAMGYYFRYLYMPLDVLIMS